jgi:hypothetical protein
MRNRVLACIAIALGLAAVTPANANPHSFVSGNGSGTACTFTSPCTSVAIALLVTDSDGLVTCVDQGANSGNISIQSFAVTKSVTIDCAGTSAAGWFVTINGAGIVVTLRNLTMNGLNATPIGIDFQNGSALFVEHCAIERYAIGSAIGINFAPSGAAKLHVTDSVIINNGNGSSGGGIVVKPSSGLAQVVIERTVVENNTYGIFANGTGGGTISAQVKDSTVANSAVNGISAYTGSAVAAVTVDHSSSLLNGGSGILSQGSAGFVFLTDTTVMSNQIGLSTASGGAIHSYGNNRLTGNVSDGVAPSTAGLALQ